MFILNYNNDSINVICNSISSKHYVQSRMNNKLNYIKIIIKFTHFKHGRVQKMAKQTDSAVCSSVY